MSRQMASVIDTVYLVEASPALRRAQHQLLCEPSSLLKETEQGFEATSKQLPGVKIVWLDSLDLVPKGSLSRNDETLFSCPANRVVD